MKLRFLGVGGAFAPIASGNSNMMLTADSGKRMMIDFGTTAPYVYRDEWGLDFKDIDAVYVSHQHADHIGGLELLAFSRYFIPKKFGIMVERPKLYCMRGLMEELWDNSLRGGLESIQGKLMNITDYFDCKPISENKSFVWEEYKFTPVQTLHVRSAYIIKYSYGLMIEHTKKLLAPRVYITTDTQFDESLKPFYDQSSIIFHDCETSEFKSIVHPNYNDLKNLPAVTKGKMWLYHYSQKYPTVKEDGFAGFVDKGQEFDF